MPLDILTLETVLKRSLEGHASLEEMLKVKRQELTQVGTQIDRLVGAMELSNMTVAALRKDLAEAVEAQKAAALAAAQAQATVEAAEQQDPLTT